jgi:hypothetical protein
MNTDQIGQRLRERAQGHRDGIANHQSWELALIFDEAADEIDRLNALIVDAKARFDDIASVSSEQEPS